MSITNSLSHNNNNNNVLDATSESVPVAEVVQSIVCRKYISEDEIKEIAVEKYRSNGDGITFKDLRTRFSLKKAQAQRRLKYFHTKGILFTAEDLVNQGNDLIQNTNPQRYFAACIKADIIEDLKQRNVPVQPTGVNLSNSSLISNRHTLSKNLEYQKAQSFLDILVQLRFAPLYIHKLQLRLSIDKQYYKELTHKEGRVNRAKTHEEIIGRRHVTYIFSPNGTVEIAVKSSDTPFKLETDEDESVIFSFLGQVRDRLLYHVSDIKERSVPAITEWVLKQCDLNKDITIDDKAQLTLPDIQLKNADRVFRQYVKSLHDKAVYRSEESLTLNHHLRLTEALENIRYTHKPIIEDSTDKASKDSGSSDRRLEV
jgi:hypothetical protein